MLLILKRSSASKYVNTGTDEARALEAVKWDNLWRHSGLKRLSTCCSEPQSVWLSDGARVTCNYQLCVCKCSITQLPIQTPSLVTPSRDNIILSPTLQFAKRSLLLIFRLKRRHLSSARSCHMPRPAHVALLRRPNRLSNIWLVDICFMHALIMRSFIDVAIQVSLEYSLGRSQNFGTDSILKEHLSSYL
jgi:hypothetical protein